MEQRSPLRMVNVDGLSVCSSCFFVIFFSTESSLSQCTYHMPPFEEEIRNVLIMFPVDEMNIGIYFISDQHDLFGQLDKSDRLVTADKGV